HVGVLDVRLDPAARGDRGAADVRTPGAGAAGPVRAADGTHVELAAGRRAYGGGARRGGQPAGPAPVRHRDDRRPRQGGTADRHRGPAGGPATYGLGTLVRAGVP